MRLLTRRTFVALGAGIASVTAAARPVLAITMDDVNWKVIPEPYSKTACDRILDALRTHRTHAALFAVGQNVDNDQGRAILDAWNSAGHILGNHTWTHRSYGNPATDTEWFERDILRNEALLKSWPNYRKLFRFPVLKEGATAERRDTMRRFLADHGYRNGCVTVDASDWYYSARLQQRLTADPAFDVQRYREPYLAHLLDRANYYNGLSTKVLGRSIPHTILVHYNLINTLFLNDALAMFQKNGWGLISAEEAFADPVYRRQPNTVPAGESLLWALAKETGKFDRELRYPGEDDIYEKPILDRLGL
jgi:peptidoglycan/xylan/chitin deacetylase (PgdA/CDA1 family)